MARGCLKLGSPTMLIKNTDLSLNLRIALNYVFLFNFRNDLNRTSDFVVYLYTFISFIRTFFNESFIYVHLRMGENTHTHSLFCQALLALARLFPIIGLPVYPPQLG